jgi:hypothetical protein
LLVIALPLFKLPFILPIALGIGICALARWTTTLRLSEFYIPVLAGFSMTGTLFFLEAVDRASERQWFIGWINILSDPASNQPDLIVIFTASLMILAALCWQAKRSGTKCLIPSTGILFLCPLAVFPVSADIGDAPQLYFVPAFISFLVLVSICAEKMSLSNGKGFVPAMVVLLLCAFNGQAVTLYATKIISDERLGYEYVNNRKIAEILREIPLTDTLIVSNSLDYPSKLTPEKIGDNRQFQISAIFGHNAFNAGDKYLRWKETSKKRSNDKLRFQEFLVAPTWNQEGIDSFLLQYPITHLLIDLNSPYPTEIPLTVIAKSQDFILYQF